MNKNNFLKRFKKRLMHIYKIYLEEIKMLS